jgi:tetratricopeptide (TPR) repeat protein
MLRLAALLSLLTLVTNNSIAQNAKSFFAEGVQLKAQRKYSDAKEKFAKAIQLKADYGEALFELGWCENEMADYASAIHHFSQTSKFWPNIAKVYFELGYAFEKSGKIDSAIANYNICVRLKPDYVNAFKQLAAITFDQRNYAAAADHYKNFLGKAPVEIKDTLYWYNKGYCEIITEDYAAAKISFLNSLKYKVDNLKLFLQLGFACKQLNQNDQAIDYYKKAIDLDPGAYTPFNGVGDVYRDNMDNMEEAMNWYKKALEINPKERKANFGMGYCLNNTGKYEEAIPYLKTAIESEPNYAAVVVELGYSYYKTGKDTSAIEYLNRAISLDGKNISALYYLSMVYVKQKNKEKALEILDQLKSLAPKYAEDLQKKLDVLSK